MTWLTQKKQPFQSSIFEIIASHRHLLTPPKKLTAWNLKIDFWKIPSFWKRIIFRFPKVRIVEKPSWKLTAIPWKLMVGRCGFPFKWYLFRGHLSLVGGFNPFQKSQLGSSPQVGVKIKKHLKPPPSSFGGCRIFKHFQQSFGTDRVPTDSGGAFLHW